VARTLFVGVAGALGALSRYGIGMAIGVRTFPWATLSINLVGSFVLGFVLAGPGAGRWSPTVTTGVAVGFLGAFTTFSTFAYEAQTMLRADEPARALTYVALSVGLGLLAAASGYSVGRATA
jgi:CrcB protein